MAFGLRRAKVLDYIIVRALTFQDFQAIADPPTSHTVRQNADRQTDGRRTCNRNTALCTIVHRAVKTEERTQIILIILAVLFLFNRCRHRSSL